MRTKHVHPRVISFVITIALSLFFGTSLAHATPSTITVTTSAATNIKQKTADLNGSVAYVGAPVTILERGFQYGTSVDYGSTAVVDGVPTVGDFNATVSGLSCGTTYHVRAYSIYHLSIGYAHPNFLIALFFPVAFASPPPDTTIYGSDTTFSTDRCTKHTSSSSVQVRIANLDTMGKTNEAQDLANTYPAAASTNMISSTSPSQIVTPPPAVGSTSPAANAMHVVFTRDLYFPMWGDDVATLQNFLIADQSLSSSSTVALRAAKATGYFGIHTKESLIEYQTAKGIVPAVGFFGPVTQKAVLTDMGLQ